MGEIVEKKKTVKGKKKKERIRKLEKENKKTR